MNTLSTLPDDEDPPLWKPKYDNRSIWRLQTWHCTSFTTATGVWGADRTSACFGKVEKRPANVSAWVWVMQRHSLQNGDKSAATRRNYETEELFSAQMHPHTNISSVTVPVFHSSSPLSEPHAVLWWRCVLWHTPRRRPGSPKTFQGQSNVLFFVL